MIALDIGGVVATVDKQPLFSLLEEYKFKAYDKFNAYFSSLQRGEISYKDFVDSICDLQALPKPLFSRIFAAMIDAKPQRILLNRVGIPYIFFSNINVVHYNKVADEIQPPDITKNHSLLSYKLGYLKPAHEFFSQLILFDLPFDNFLYIDDKLANLAVAKKFGLQTAFCPKPSTLAQILKAYGLLLG